MLPNISAVSYHKSLTTALWVLLCLSLRPCATRNASIVSQARYKMIHYFIIYYAGCRWYLEKSARTSESSSHVIELCSEIPRRQLRTYRARVISVTICCIDTSGANKLECDSYRPNTFSIWYISLESFIHICFPSPNSGTGSVSHSMTLVSNARGYLHSG